MIKLPFSEKSIRKNSLMVFDAILEIVMILYHLVLLNISKCKWTSSKRLEQGKKEQSRKPPGHSLKLRKSSLPMSTNLTRFWGSWVSSSEVMTLNANFWLWTQTKSFLSLALLKILRSMTCGLETSIESLEESRLSLTKIKSFWLKKSFHWSEI